VTVFSRRSRAQRFALVLRPYASALVAHALLVSLTVFWPPELLFNALPFRRVSVRHLCLAGLPAQSFVPCGVRWKTHAILFTVQFCCICWWIPPRDLHCDPFRCVALPLCTFTEPCFFVGSSLSLQKSTRPMLCSSFVVLVIVGSIGVPVAISPSAFASLIVVPAPRLLFS